VEEAGQGGVKPPEQYLRDALGGIDVRSLLDVGTGHSGVFDFARWESAGLERKACLDIAYIRPDTPKTWVRIYATAERLPFKDSSWDLVQSTEMIEHIDPERHKEVLSELIRVASKGVFVTSTDETGHTGEPQRRAEELNPHQAYRGIVEAKLLEEMGFQILQKSQHQVKAFLFKSRGTPPTTLSLC